MVKIPKEMIIERIKEKTKLSDEQINSKIKNKLSQLSGLISEEGAAHIVANELGVKLYETPEKLQVKNILPGMRNVNLVGKVVRVFDIRHFETENRKGKVGSFILGDETGVIRVVAWNDKADLISNISPEDMIKIESAYARENNRGLRELHLGDRSNIIIDPKGVKEIKTPGTIRKTISELKDNEDNIELLGTIVQVFEPRFFEICPECGKRVRETEGEFHCDTHGNVEPNYSYVLNLFLDDGTDNIRVVLWRDQMQKIFDMEHAQLVEYKDQSFEELKNDLLGRIVKFVGRTSKNEMFDRIEFIPQLVIRNPDPEEEVERIKKENKIEKKEEEVEPVKPKEEKIEPNPSQEETEKKSPENSDEDMEEIEEPSESKEKEDEDIEILSLEDLESL